MEKVRQLRNNKNGELSEENLMMNEAEFEAWLMGSSKKAFSREGVRRSLRERDYPKSSKCATWFHENGIYVGSAPEEQIAMLADAACCQQPGQCAHCLQGLCSERVSNELERVVL